MGKIKNTAQINTYNEPAKPSLKIHSHWNRRELVELEIEGERLVVSGLELKQAIDNCMNVGL